jgi:hypothetical protein
MSSKPNVVCSLALLKKLIREFSEVLRFFQEVLNYNLRRIFRRVLGILRSF